MTIKPFSTSVSIRKSGSARKFLANTGGFYVFRSKKRAWIKEWDTGRVRSWWKPKRSNADNKAVAEQRIAEYYRKVVTAPPAEPSAERKNMLYNAVVYVSYDFTVEIDAVVARPREESVGDALAYIGGKAFKWLLDQEKYAWIKKVPVVMNVGLIKKPLPTDDEREDYEIGKLKRTLPKS